MVIFSNFDLVLFFQIDIKEKTTGNGKQLSFHDLLYQAGMNRASVGLFVVSFLEERVFNSTSVTNH